jgi:hypothetical protein
MSDSFFDYYCDRCDTPFCERVHIMNLALDNVEEAYCMSCLAQEFSQSPQQLAAFVWDYIIARDCFRNPWRKFNASDCPRLEAQQCYCQREIA